VASFSLFPFFEIENNNDNDNDNAAT